MSAHNVMDGSFEIGQVQHDTALGLFIAYVWYRGTLRQLSHGERAYLTQEAAADAVLHASIRIGVAY